MASSLLLRLTRPVSAYRLLSIHGRCPVSSLSENIIKRYYFDRRCYTTRTDPSFDQAWLRSQKVLLPGVHSALFTRVKGKHVALQIPGLEKTETDAGLCVTLNMPGVSKEDVNARVDGKYLLIQGKLSDEEIYLAGMKLPANFNKKSDWNGEMKDGMLKLTLPKKKFSIANFFSTGFLRNFVHQNVIIKFAFILNGFKLARRSFQAIGHPEGSPPIIYSNMTAERVYIKVSYALVEVKSTNEGLCVSINMPGFKIEDVRSFSRDDYLKFTAKRESEYYLGRVPIPEGYVKKKDMMKIEMHDGMYKATLPRMTKEMEEREKKKANQEFYIN